MKGKGKGKGGSRTEEGNIRRPPGFTPVQHYARSRTQAQSQSQSSASSASSSASISTFAAAATASRPFAIPPRSSRTSTPSPTSTLVQGISSAALPRGGIGKLGNISPLQAAFPKSPGFTTKYSGGDSSRSGEGQNKGKEKGIAFPHQKKDAPKGKYGNLKRSPKRSVNNRIKQRQNFNSTSSVYAEQTLQKPINSKTIRAVAMRVSDYIVNAKTLASNARKQHSRQRFNFNFNEPGYNMIDQTTDDDTGFLSILGSALSMMRSDRTRAEAADAVQNKDVKTPGLVKPSLKNIDKFMRHIFKYGQLSLECNIICLVYIERLLQSGRVGAITLYNWRVIVAISFIMASKIWDDLSMSNADFATFLPFSLSELNEYERTLLAALQVIY